jgi:predicted dehydrogenase
VKPLNIAIVGAGRMGWIFARALHQMPQQARVAHVVSRSLDSAAKMGDYFACPFGKTLETALPHVDAVVIAAATPAHADLAIACAQAGKPFFVEKPIADTLENGRRIVRTLEQHPVLNMVGFHRRFDPAYSRAKQHIEAGKLGQLEVFRSISRDASMGSSSLEFHLAAHGLHDTAVAILHFKSGAFGSIEMARNTAYGHEVRTEVLGAKGKISLERDQRFELTIYDASGGHFDRPRGFEERFAAAYLCEMSAFVQAILAGQTLLLPDAKDAWHSLRLAMAAQEALNTGKTIVVDSFGGTL